MKVLFSRFIAPEVLFEFQVTIVPPTSPEPPVPPVPAEAPPLFSLPAPLDTTPPSPALPPSLPRATLSPERERASVKLLVWFCVGATRLLSTTTPSVRPLMSTGQSQPRSTSASVLFPSFVVEAIAVAFPVRIKPPAAASPPLPPFPAEAPPLFSLPRAAPTFPPRPPRPPTLPPPIFPPVAESAVVVLPMVRLLRTLIVMLPVCGGSG